jgi:biopolymer transport protein TolR
MNGKFSPVILLQLAGLASRDSRELQSFSECPIHLSARYPEHQAAMALAGEKGTAMSMILGSRKDVSSEMNVTPLIDVLLVLLIIFMVLLPHHYFGEAAEIPSQDKGGPRGPEPTVVIRLINAGEEQRPALQINEETVLWDTLEQRLREIYQPRMEKVAFLNGDPDIRFENVAEVLDVTHRAGVDRIGLIDEKSRP